MARFLAATQLTRANTRMLEAALRYVCVGCYAAGGHLRVAVHNAVQPEGRDQEPAAHVCEFPVGGVLVEYVVAMARRV